MSHYGEEIHSQLTGIDRDLPQSLSSVGVQQDLEPVTLPVESADPLADLSHRLTRGKAGLNGGAHRGTACSYTGILFKHER